jgi:hypothetical protein
LSLPIFIWRSNHLCDFPSARNPHPWTSAINWNQQKKTLPHKHAHHHIHTLISHLTYLQLEMALLHHFSVSNFKWQWMSRYIIWQPTIKQCRTFYLIIINRNKIGPTITGHSITSRKHIYEVFWIIFACGLLDWNCSKVIH